MKSALAKFILSTLAVGLVLSGFQVWAKTPSFNFVPSKGSLRDALQKSDWPQAFAQWQVHVAGSDFAKSPNSLALYALILSKNEMPTLGFETLFRAQKPSVIVKELKSYLKQEFSTENPLWLYSEYKWKKEWQSIFGEDLKLRRDAFARTILKTPGEFKKATQLLAQTKAHTPEWAWLQWQLASSHLVQDRVSESALHFRALLNSKQNVIGRDQILMGLARAEFQINRFDEALRIYSQISKSSDYWLEALEEKAWSHIRKNDYRKALSQLETVLSPVFSIEIGPEPYFVNSFANLKICDFQSVFKIHDRFKNLYRTRTLELQALASTGKSLALDDALTLLQNGATRWSELGANVEKLPRFLHRDYEVANHVNRKRALSAERVRLKNLMNEVSSQYTTANLASHLENELSAIDAKLERISLALTKRAKVLAQNELDEISHILNKLHIVEAESIQRLHLYDKYAKRTKTEFDDKGDALVFPKDDEIWLDELDHYQVNATGCPVFEKLAKKEGRTL